MTEKDRMINNLKDKSEKTKQDLQTVSNKLQSALAGNPDGNVKDKDMEESLDKYKVLFNIGVDISFLTYCQRLSLHALHVELN